MVNLKKDTVNAWIDTLTRWARALEDGYYEECARLRQERTADWRLDLDIDGVYREYCYRWDVALDRAYKMGAPDLVVDGYVVRPCFY